MLVVERFGNVRQSVATIENMRDDKSSMYYHSWFRSILLRAGFTRTQVHRMWVNHICELDGRGRVMCARLIVTRVIRPGSQAAALLLNDHVLQ